MNKKEWNREKNIKALLEHPGWKEYDAKVVEKIEYHEEQIRLICSKGVRVEELNDLNDHLAAKNIFTQILNIKQELLEDIENSSESADVKETQVVSMEN